MSELFNGKNLNQVFVITGRVAHDDDDTIHFVEAPSMAEAKVIFKKSLAVGVLDIMDEDDREDPDALEEAMSEIYINSANSVANYLKGQMLTQESVEDVDVEFKENNFTASPGWGESGEAA